MNRFGWPEWGALVLSALLLAYAAAFFAETKDPYVFAFAGFPIALLWLAVLVVRAFLHGFPNHGDRNEGGPKQD